MLSSRRIAYTGAVLGLGLGLASVLVLRSNKPLPPPPPEVQRQAEEATPPAIDFGQPVGQAAGVPATKT